MKFFVFLLGIAAGVFGHRYYQTQIAQTPPKKEVVYTTPGATENSPSFSERVREDAKSAKDAVGKELEHAGQAVRTKASEVGATVASAASNTRIVATIKTKYALDSELKARGIDVDCEGGIVTLRGTVANPALIAKAVNFALDTDGVTKVQSQLTVVAEKR